MSWISIKDRQPDDAEQVIVWARDWKPNVQFGRYIGDLDEWRVVQCNGIEDSITHWQPMPAPPAQGTPQPQPQPVDLGQAPSFDEWWHNTLGVTAETAHLTYRGVRDSAVMESIKAVQRKAWDAGVAAVGASRGGGTAGQQGE